MAGGGSRHQDGTSRFLTCSILLAGAAALLAVLLVSDQARAEAGYGEGTVQVSSCDGATVSMQIRERDMLQLINERRQTIRQKPFCVHPKLQQAARSHSTDMVKRNYYDHRSPDDKYAFHRAREQGYEGGEESGVWENIAQARIEDDPRVTFEKWMNSSDHRYALLKDYGSSPEVGIGAADGEWVHWTLNMSDAYVPPEASKPPAAKPKPNAAPRIGKLRVANTKIRRGQYTRPRIQAVVRDRETSLQRRQIAVRVDGKKMRVRYNRHNDQMVVRTQRLKRGKHMLVIRAADGKRVTIKRVRFRVR